MGPNKLQAPKRIVIVGAGIIGLTTAYKLAAKGHDVTVLESQDDVAVGCSLANAALLTPSMSYPLNAPGSFGQLLRSFFSPDSPLNISPIPALRNLSWGLSFLRHSNRKHFAYATAQNFELSNYSLTQTTKLKRELGIQFDNAESGCLKVFHRRSKFRAAKEGKDKFKHDAMPVRYLDTDDTCELEPTLAPAMASIVGSIFYAHDQIGDASMFAKHLAAAFLDLGGRISFGTTVFGINTLNGGVTSIETQEGTIAADIVVLATGHKINDLLSGFGEQLPIAPLKGYTLTLSGVKGKLPKIPIVDADANVVVTPLGDRLRISGFAELTERDLEIPADRIRTLIHAATRLFPYLANDIEGATLSPWAGLRPVSTDGLPFIGETSVRNLFVGAGHGHLGWTMAAGTAGLLTAQIDGEPEEISGSPYLPSRLKVHSAA